MEEGQSLLQFRPIQRTLCQYLHCIHTQHFTGHGTGNLQFLFGQNERSLYTSKLLLYQSPKLEHDFGYGHWLWKTKTSISLDLFGEFTHGRMNVLMISRLMLQDC
jgi:hypothetical protein